MNDPLLDRLAEASDAAAADALVEELVSFAGPVIDRVAAYYRRRGLLNVHELDDVASTVRMRLLMKLRRIAAGERSEIASFSGYVAALAYNTVNDLFRLRDPERARLRGRLRAAAQRDPRIVIETTERGTVLSLREPTVAPLRADEANDELVAVLRAAHAPLLLEEAVAAMLGPQRRDVLAETSPDEAPATPVRMERRQNLEFLWREIGQLPQRQRAALLLNMRADDGGNASALLVLVGVATLDDVARTIGIDTAELLAIWNDLPLDDLTIASRLGLTRQQVIDLRRSARERLGRKMKSRR